MRRTVRAFVSKWVAPLWPVTVIGILVGALIGAVFLGPSGAYTAIAVIRVDQPIDANQIMTAPQPLMDAQPDYVAGEMVYLTSPGFLDSVRKALNQASKPMLSASQSGKSNLVTISATADTLDNAKRTVNTAITTYVDHIKQQTNERYQAALDAVNAIIPQLEDALRQVQPPPDKPTDELVQLYLQRTALQVQMQRAPGVQVVQPTMESISSAKLPASSLGTIGGGLLGGLLALAGALAWRSRSGTITSPSQIEGAAAPPLLPVIRLDGDAVDAAAARAIYAQLPSPRSGDILVIGASPDSGTATAARHIAFAAAEHGKVATADLVTGVGLDGDDHAHTGPEDNAVQADGVTTVIDGGTLENSPALLDVADHASIVVIVVRIGLDTNAAIGAATRAIAKRDAPVSVVCTRAPFIGFRRSQPEA
jgi:hypothetical protein